MKRTTRTLALAALAFFYLEVASRHAFHRFDHFENRIAALAADIDDRRGIPFAQVRHRPQMRVGQVRHVHVVANARAVGGWVVGAEDRDRLALAESD